MTALWHCQNPKRKEGRNYSLHDFLPPPALAHSRTTRSDDLLNLVVQLSLYTQTSITDALSLPISVGQSVFSTKAFDDWKKYRESEQKLQVGIAERLNNIIIGLNNLGKVRRF